MDCSFHAGSGPPEQDRVGWAEDDPTTGPKGSSGDRGKGLALGLMQLLLGISYLLLGIYILYLFIVCIYSADIGKGLTGICWDGAQKTGVELQRHLQGQGEPWIWAELCQSRPWTSWARAAKPRGLGLGSKPDELQKVGKCRISVGFGCCRRDLMRRHREAKEEKLSRRR